MDDHQVNYDDEHSVQGGDEGGDNQAVGPTHSVVDVGVAQVEPVEPHHPPPPKLSPPQTTTPGHINDHDKSSAAHSALLDHGDHRDHDGHGLYDHHGLKVHCALHWICH